MKDDSRFEENLKRFAFFSKEEADLLKNVTCSRVFLSPNANGELNLEIKDKDEINTLYSKESVAYESSHWFSNLKVENTKILYVFGIGLGAYYTAAKTWLCQDPSRFLIFLENDKEILHHFFQTELATEILHDRQVRLHYLFGSEIFEHPIIDTLTTAFLFDPYKISSLHYYQIVKQKELEALIQTFSHCIYTKQSRMGEFLTGSRSFFTNYYNNLKFLPNSNFGNGLFGKFKNVPAIICGAGPSLEKNIHLLKLLSDKALIIAGGSAINALNSYDLIPHFTAGIDPNPAQLTRILANYSYETPFFYRNRIFTEALNMVSGPKLYLTGAGGYDLPNWIEKRLEIDEKTVIDEGYNVINFSVSIAHALGCNPIILCGVDLAYTYNQSYVSLMKFHALHNFKQSFITKGPQDELVGFKDIKGSMTTTLWKWINEATWFTYFQKGHQDKLLINATEGGIGFPNIPNMTLDEVAKKYLTKTYDFESMVHGEIQNSSFSEKVNENAILKLLKLLRKGLGKCELFLKSFIEKAHELQMMRLKNPKCEIEPYLKELIKIEAPLLKEDYYKFVLKQFVDNYFWMFEERIPYFLYDLDKEDKDSKIMTRVELQLDSYKFVSSVIQLNKHILEDAIKKYKKPSILKKKKHSLHVLEKIEPEETDGQKEVLYYNNHVIKSIQYLKNGLLDGSSTFYSEDGIVLANSHYIKGLRDGEVKFFYLTGEKYAVKRFIHGVQDGLQEFYYKDGTLKSEIPYTQGKLDGVVKLYYPNGALKRELHFKNGLRDGVEKMYSEEGLTLIDAVYLDDEPVQEAKWWYDSQVLRQSVIHHEIKEDYEIHCFTEDGKEIPKEIVEQEDYFDRLIKITNALMESMEDVFKKADLILPYLKGQDAKQISETKEQLEDLHKKMTDLASMNRNIKEKFSGNPHLLEEPIWKSNALQKKIDEQLNGLIEMMKNEIAAMQLLIQEAIEKIK